MIFLTPDKWTDIFSFLILEYLPKSEEKELGNELNASFSARLPELSHKGAGLTIAAAQNLVTTYSWGNN